MHRPQPLLQENDDCWSWLLTRWSQRGSGAVHQLVFHGTATRDLMVEPGAHATVYARSTAP